MSDKAVLQKVSLFYHLVPSQKMLGFQLILNPLHLCYLQGLSVNVILSPCIQTTHPCLIQFLGQTFQDFLKNPESFYDKELLDSSKQMAPNLAAGSGMAVIGVILATLTNGAVFDITGGILTTIGVIFAGASIGYKRRKILKSFKEEINKGQLVFQHFFLLIFESIIRVLLKP